MSSGMRILEEEIDRYTLNKSVKKIEPKPLTIQSLSKEKPIETFKIK